MSPCPCPDALPMGRRVQSIGVRSHVPKALVGGHVPQALGGGTLGRGHRHWIAC